MCYMHAAVIQNWIHICCREISPGKNTYMSRHPKQINASYMTARNGNGYNWQVAALGFVITPGSDMLLDLLGTRHCPHGLFIILMRQWIITNAFSGIKVLYYIVFCFLNLSGNKVGQLYNIYARYHTFLKCAIKHQFIHKLNYSIDLDIM